MNTRIIAQITPIGKRLQLDKETYAEIDRDFGRITIHQGSRTGSHTDWGGKVIGYLSLAHAVQVVKAALDINEHLDDEDAEIEAMLRRYEEQQDAKADATSAHSAWD